MGEVSKEHGARKCARCGKASGTKKLCADCTRAKRDEAAEQVKKEDERERASAARDRTLKVVAVVLGALSIAIAAYFFARSKDHESDRGSIEGPSRSRSGASDSDAPSIVAADDCKRFGNAAREAFLRETSYAEAGAPSDQVSRTLAEQQERQTRNKCEAELVGRRIPAETKRCLAEETRLAQWIACFGRAVGEAR